MKKYLDIRNFIILILILLCTIEFLNPKGFMPNRTKLIYQIDSVPFAVHDTTEIEVPVEVEIPYEVRVPYEVKVEVPVIQSVDTSEILKGYLSKVSHNEVLMLPNNQGTVTITDTISKNNIVNRKFIADVKRMIIKDTVYTQIPRKTEVFLGVDAKFDKPNVVNIIGLSMLFKNKDDNHLYKLGVGVTNRIDDVGTTGKLVPFIGGGVYWKVKLRR
jgi:hypothetical protein